MNSNFFGRRGKGLFVGVGFYAALFVLFFVLLFSDGAHTASAVGSITVDKTVFKDNNSSSTTVVSPSFSTVVGNELLLAFIATDGNSGMKVNSISGGGLTWTLVKRTNAQLGTAEIWKAFSVGTLTNISVTATLSQSVSSSMTVMTFSGVDAANPVGASNGASASTGAPTVSLTTTRNNSLVIGVGNDWSRAVARTVGANQTMIHQMLATVGDTYWMQQQTNPTPLSGTVVPINDTAPNNDRWNLSIVEVLPVSDAQAPTAPSNLTANGNIGNAVLNWDAATDNVAVTSYNIHRSTTSGFTTSPANKISQTSSLTYTDTFAPGTYYYLVTAQDAVGNVGPASNEALSTIVTDTTSPTISITVPLDGASVVGNNVTVSANASDNVGVLGVQFKLDGNNLNAEDTTAPYSISWNTTSLLNGTHILTATARDAAGNTTNATEVNVSVANPPVISGVLATSITPTSAVINWNTNISADSQINYGTVLPYDSLTTLDLALITSHSQSISGLTPQTLYHYQVASKDINGIVGTSSDKTFTTLAAPDTTFPLVSITAPIDQSEVSGTITISATASDNVGVVGVQFKVDGNNVGAEDTTSSYSVLWDTTPLSNASHSLTAVARDAAGNVTISEIVAVNVNNPPMLIITQPTQNASINGATLNITYTTMGDMTGVDGVIFQLDGGPIMRDMTFDGTFQITSVSPGSHVLSGFLTQLEMMVMDSDATPVTFTMIAPDTTPPTVSILTPANNSTVSGTQTITASASDNIGIAGVQFKIDGTNLGPEDTVAPYSISWDTTIYSNASHTITAVARDAALNTTSTVATVTVNNVSGPALLGQWSSTVTTPFIFVHGVLMNNGKVLGWSVGNQARVFDPIANTFASVPDNLTDVFCAGQVSLSNGKVLVVGGGGAGSGQATRHVDIFNPSTSSWSAAGQMNLARWYPTATVLADGRILSVAGADGGVTNYVGTPEIYNPQTNIWTLMASSANNPNTPNYPFMYVLPNGKVAFVGGSEYDTITQTLDISTQTWTTISNTITPGSSSVMYAPGKIMKSGSAADSGFSGNAGKTTYVIDFNQPSPAWRKTSDMAFPRSFMNLTNLPDGTVLVTGGETTKDGSNPTNAVKAAELWNPTTETWTTMASEARPRLYHSIALLLPDGRVLVSGGGQDSGVPDEFNAEYYSPTYLFKGTRPSVTSSPSTVQYGSQFFVGTPDGSSIASVALIKAGAVTHFTNMEQRFMNLTFTQTSGGITVDAPANPNLATPGLYLLFLVNSNGVPSIAPFVTLPSSFDDSQAPTIPTNIVANGTIGSANLSWNASTDNVGVVRYNVYRSTISGFTPSPANLVGQPTFPSFNDNNLVAGNYYYKVTAQDAANNVSVASAEALAVVIADTTSPTVSITTPLEGSSISGNNVVISAAASDNVGVVGVQFKVDGNNVGAEDITSPYSAILDATSFTDGSSHALTAVARDSAGNSTVSQIVNVIVSNPLTAPVISSFTANPTSIVVGSSTTLSWSISGNPAPTLSIDNGIGVVTGTSRTVSPTVTTTYILTATNSVGSTTAQAIVTVTAAPALAIDANIFKDNGSNSATIVSPALTTTTGNELLLAFIATDATSSGITVQSVTGGGLTWTLVKRTNAQLGTSEVWKAFAPSIVTNAAITATLSQSVAASMTIVTFIGANSANPIGASVSGSASTGAPTVNITTTANNSWIFGVGNDYNTATARTLGPNQTMVHQYLAPVGDTYWVQRQNALTPTAGTVVTINDTAPTFDRWNLTVVEVRSQ